MRQYLGENAPQLAGDVLAALMNHSWPGNIRELQNAVQRAAILSAGGTPRESDFLLGRTSSLRPEVIIEPSRGELIDGGDELEEFDSAPVFPTKITKAGEELHDPLPSSAALMIRSGMTVQEMEKALILETLRSTQNNRTEAAKLLGISIRTLRNKLHDYRQDGIVIDE